MSRGLIVRRLFELVAFAAVMAGFAYYWRQIIETWGLWPLIPLAAICVSAAFWFDRRDGQDVKGKEYWRHVVPPFAFLAAFVAVFLFVDHQQNTALFWSAIAALAAAMIYYCHRQTRRSTSAARR